MLMNEMIFAAIVIADGKKTGTMLDRVQIETLCKMSGVDATIVSEFVEASSNSEEVKKTVEFATDAIIAFSVAKSVNPDDEDLKEATIRYAEYTQSIQKLRDKYSEKVSTMYVDIQSKIDQIKSL